MYYSNTAAFCRSSAPVVNLKGKRRSLEHSWRGDFRFHICKQCHARMGLWVRYTERRVAHVVWWRRAEARLARRKQFRAERPVRRRTPILKRLALLLVVAQRRAPYIWLHTDVEDETFMALDTIRGGVAVKEPRVPEHQRSRRTLNFDNTILVAHVGVLFLVERHPIVLRLDAPLVKEQDVVVEVRTRGHHETAVVRSRAAHVQEALNARAAFAKRRLIAMEPPAHRLLVRHTARWDGVHTIERGPQAFVAIEFGEHGVGQLARTPGRVAVRELAGLHDNALHGRKEMLGRVRPGVAEFHTAKRDALDGAPPHIIERLPLVRPGHVGHDRVAIALQLANVAVGQHCCVLASTCMAKVSILVVTVLSKSI